MSNHISTANNIRAIVTTADRAGATLPADVDAIARHALDLGGLDTKPAAKVVDDLVSLLGDRAAFDAAVPDALAEVARAAAFAGLKSQVLSAATFKAWQTIQANREAVISAVAEALAPEIDTLTKQAGKIPHSINLNRLDDLDPTQFAAWHKAQPAAEALEAAARGLAPLYPLQADTVVNLSILHRLPLVTVPTIEGVQDCHRYLDAIEGRRRTGSNVGPTGSDFAGFWPARVAHLGGTFTFSGPAETAAKAQQLRAAAVPPRSAA